MKKRLLIVILVMVFVFASGFSLAQTIIENSAKLDNRRAGRMVTMKEEMRIADTSGKFFLKYVFGLAVAADGTILINDSGEQALQFDGRGRYIRNLMKKGQGPGELTQITGILIGNERIVLCGTPPKVVVFDNDGKMIGELDLRGDRSTLIKLFDDDGADYLFSRSSFPDVWGGSGWKDIRAEIIKVDRQSGEAKSLASFTMPGYVAVASGMNGTVYHSFIAVPAGNGKIAISCTPDYLIKLIDREKGNVIREFRRKYDRKKRFTRQEAERRGGAPEYWDDILALHVVDGNIWAQTSTIDPKKGVLFDVFDQSGAYIDRFYLKWSDKDVDPKNAYKNFTFAGGFVYFDDKADDDLIVIRKCRLIGL